MTSTGLSDSSFALVIYFIITEPKTAAGVVHSVARTLRYAADSITTFFSAVL